MNEHSRWENVKGEKVSDREMTMYVKGYILGCEDALKEIGNLWFYEGIGQLREEIERALAEAKATLRKLTE